MEAEELFKSKMNEAFTYPKMQMTWWRWPYKYEFLPTLKKNNKKKNLQLFFKKEKEEIVIIADEEFLSKILSMRECSFPFVEAEEP